MVEDGLGLDQSWILVNQDSVPLVDDSGEGGVDCEEVENAAAVAGPIAMSSTLSSDVNVIHENWHWRKT